MHQCPLCGFQTDDAMAMFSHLGGYQPYPRPAGHEHSGGATLARAIGRDYKAGLGEGAGEFDVGGLRVRLHGKGAATPRSYGSGMHKSAKHRIYVECPTCHKEIPAGRIHQHLIVHKARTKVCEVCGKTYGTGNHLRTHMRQAHGAARHGRFGTE